MCAYDAYGVYLCVRMLHMGRVCVCVYVCYIWGVFVYVCTYVTYGVCLCMCVRKVYIWCVCVFYNVWHVSGAVKN